MTRTLRPLLLATLMLSGCSGYSFHTNLDKENFTNYFKPGSVALVTDEQIADLNYLVLGTVEGNACQQDENQPAPTEGDARTDGRIKVADMGGNGVLFSKCVTLDNTPGCLSSVVCYGQALKVAPPKE
ncbi:MAG: Rcs stress response system protein RcsF [Aeromonadaceae bacterium]